MLDSIGLDQSWEFRPLATEKNLFSSVKTTRGGVLKFLLTVFLTLKKEPHEVVALFLFTLHCFLYFLDFFLYNILYIGTADTVLSP